MRIAVVGAGISGLSAAWLLGPRHDVVLYEAEGRLGGHSNTVDVNAPEGRCPVDTGFIVYNTAAYPNLISFFAALGVETAPSGMSFSVSMDGGAYEYSGSGFTGLFGQPRNAVRVHHWRMVAEIFRFFREAQDDRANEPANATLGGWLAARGFSKTFIHGHIAPMAAAIWSAPVDEMLEFPFAAFSRFFANHGLLQASGRPAWRTVRGGSRAYVERVRQNFTGRVSLGDPVVKVTGTSSRASVRTKSGAEDYYDAVLLACHADDVQTMLSSGEQNARRCLSAFRYQRNVAVLHTDKTFMPQRRRLWSSWNYLDARDGISEQGAGDMSVTYWMNRLQPLATKTNYFVTLNPHREPASTLVEREFVYEHPVFTPETARMQRQLWSLQGKRNTWFCGAHFGAGFHEDGLQAGLAVAEQLGGVKRPWQLTNPSTRIHVSPSSPVHVRTLTEAAE